MTSFEVKERFFRFFEKKQHKMLPSSSLLPQNDPSLLFVNAGMNPFKDIFLGLTSPTYKNVTTIQKCLRAGGKHNDLESVGLTAFHHTFFEMMGNFSFGGYFKKQAISMAWEFLTKHLGLEAENLYVSVYRHDEESFALWKDGQNIPEHKIYRLDEKDNFWQMGDTGPCGPCSEIHYYKGDKKNPTPKDLTEIWNLVFMEFYDTHDKQRKKLAQPCVDTGMGLERLCCVLQGQESNYHTDLFVDILHGLEKACGKKYDFKEHNQDDLQKAFRVLADHSRSISFLVDDGVLPGSEGASYVLRRIIRRALYYSQKLSPKKDLLQKGIEQTISFMSKSYPSLKKQSHHIHCVVETETKRFFDNLQNGRKKLKDHMLSLKEKHIDVETLWDLHSTYGFPKDLTWLIAKEKGWSIATKEEFADYEKRQKLSDLKKSMPQQTHDFVKNFSVKMAGSFLPANKKTLFTGYETSTQQSHILFIQPLSECIKDTFSSEKKSVLPSLSSFKDEQTSDASQTFSSDLKDQKKESISLTKNMLGFLVADKSPFYPESGGAIGDKGLLQTKTGLAEVLDCQQKAEIIFHKVKVLKGYIKTGQECFFAVNSFFREAVAVSHTATHLLHAALKSVLGDGVRQAGSLVEPGRLRFDFTCLNPLTLEQIHKIEDKVWQSIARKEDLFSRWTSFKQAVSEGALFLQGENYQSKVRVISIGDGISTELCGGIHVKNTKDIKSFKIISEKGIQAGVRRIIAYTGLFAMALESFLTYENQELRKYLYHDSFDNKKEKSQTGKTLSSQDDLSRSVFPIVNMQFCVEHGVETKDRPFCFKKENSFWTGSIEKQNLFLGWLQHKEKELQNLKKKIVCLNPLQPFPIEAFSLKPLDKNLVVRKTRFHPLAMQVLELREHFKLPFLK